MFKLFFKQSVGDISVDIIQMNNINIQSYTLKIIILIEATPVEVSQSPFE